MELGGLAVVDVVAHVQPATSAEHLTPANTQAQHYQDKSQTRMKSHFSF